jgi:hypothetical protein
VSMLATTPIVPRQKSRRRVLRCARDRRGLEKRGLAISDDDLGKAFAATDTDGDGTVDFKEWQASGMATAVDAVAQYATSGSGVLTLDQARAKLHDIGVPREWASSPVAFRNLSSLLSSGVDCSGKDRPGSSCNGRRPLWHDRSG